MKYCPAPCIAQQPEVCCLDCTDRCAEPCREDDYCKGALDCAPARARADVDRRDSHNAKDTKGELKTCPFCRGTATIAKYGLSYTATCENCNAETAPRTDRKEAAALWNRRAYESLYGTIQDYAMRGCSRAEVVAVLESGREGR